jgi:hypothetical protein
MVDHSLPSIKETIACDLMQLLRREFLGDDNPINVTDQQVLYELNNLVGWGDFLTQYERLDNKDFQAFILSKIEQFKDNLNERRKIADLSRTDANTIAVLSGSVGLAFIAAAGSSAATIATTATTGAAASAAGVGVAVGAHALDFALSGGAFTLLAIGTYVVANYFGKQGLAAEKDMNSVDRRLSELKEVLKRKSSA